MRLGLLETASSPALEWLPITSFGAVDQLVDRLYGIQKAVGSSPTSSTLPTEDAKVVGAHEFRNHFGLFMQRASLGERFYVTRRGRPYVVLSPAEPILCNPEGGENEPPDPSPEHE